MEKADRPMKAEKEGKETGPSFGTVNFERRKHPRMAVNLSVEYWKENAPLIAIHDDINIFAFVIPGLTRNPVFS